MLKVPELLKSPNFWSGLRIWGTFILLFVLKYDPAVEAFGWSVIGLWFFLFLVFTDGLDGWLARKLDRESRIGIWLDPLADKVLVLAVLFFFWSEGTVRGWILYPLALREIFVTVKRWAFLRRGFNMPANRMGKLKASAEYTAAALFILGRVEFIILGNLALAISLFLAFASLFKFRPSMKVKEKNIT